KRTRHRVVERIHAETLRGIYVVPEAGHVAKISAELDRMARRAPSHIVQDLHCSITPGSRGVTAGLLKTGDVEIRNGTARWIRRQACQAKFARNEAGSNAKLSGCMLLREASADLIQERRADYKIVGDGQAVVRLGQCESAEQRRSVDRAAIL